MIALSTMIIRLLIAIVLGGIIGLERELIGKEAGLRTNIVVASGAAIFSIISISLPYIIATSPENLNEILARNSGFLTVIANIVVGIGFLGAGIILHQGSKVRSLTTAAVIWFSAAIGIACGIGLINFAITATVLITSILFFTRKLFLKNLNNNNDQQDIS
ncbi:MAG: MgtC/SapB family protein [Minisyncoccia bacterium]